MKEDVHNLVKFTKGAYVTVQDKRVPDNFYVIQEGHCFLQETYGARKGDTLGRGDFFGIISAMSGYNQIETVQAMDNVTLLSIRFDQFDKFIINNPQITRKILIEFSKLVRFLDEAMTGETMGKDAFEKDTKNLYNTGEYFASQKQFEAAAYAFHQYIKHHPDGADNPLIQTRFKEIAKNVRVDFKPKKIDDLTRAYLKGTMIFAESEPGDEVFVIKKGLVKISKVVDSREVLIALLKEGEIFGEMALLESKLRGASAIAFSDCTLMVINKTNFEQLISTQPKLITSLTSLLAKRIWITNKQLANTRIEDPVARMQDMLFIQLEKRRVDFNTKEKYVFDFGPNELMCMVGAPNREFTQSIQKLFQNKLIFLESGKIAIRDLIKFYNQANYLRNTR